MTTGTTPTRFLIVDDHPVFRAGVCALLGDAFDGVFDEASTADEALDLARDRAFDLALVDISLPGRNGIDLVEQLATVGSPPRILVVSIHPESQYALRAIRAGAAGYVGKVAPGTELVDAVRGVLDGGRHVSPELEERLRSVRQQRARLHDGLSDREMEVLCLIGRGRTVSEIAAQLRLSVKTISTYRARILDKTAMRTNAEMMRYALDNGLVD